MPRRELPTTHTRITAENERKLKRRVSAQAFVGGDTYGPYADGAIQGAYWFDLINIDSGDEGSFFTTATPGAGQVQLGSFNQWGTAASYVEDAAGGLLQLDVAGLWSIEAVVRDAGSMVAGEVVAATVEPVNDESINGSNWADASVQAWLPGGLGMESNTTTKLGSFEAGAQFNFKVLRADLGATRTIGFRLAATLLGAGTIL